MNVKTISHTQKILLIEDDEGLTRLITIMLERGGYNAIIANSGKQGIVLARQERPELILCDISMPDVNGFDVLRALHNHSTTATIPFIFLTAHTRPEDIRVGMELGADDYLTKPVHPDVLLKAISTRLKRHQVLQADRLAVFAQQMVLSQELSRQQMAYMLDNEVNQSLRSLQFIFNMLAPSSHQDAPLYKDAKNLLGNLVQRVEGLAQEMHPTILGRLGLVPAIRWLTEQYDLEIELETENLDYKFDSQVEICIFRLIQESLNNTAHHAQINEAKISLKYMTPFIEVRVEDKGVGFDLEQVLQSNQSMGLQYMYSLVAQSKGELHIMSEPNASTVVYALLPQTTVDPAVHQSISQTFLRLASRPRPMAPTAATDIVKILLAMEQPLQLQGLHKLLASNTQFQVVGEIQDLTKIVSSIKEHNPQLLIINPITEGKSQTEILLEIMDTYPQMTVLVISPVTHDIYVRAAFEHGALGYIPNTATITDLNSAIMHVAKMQYYLSPTLTFNLAQWQELKTV